MTEGQQEQECQVCGRTLEQLEEIKAEPDIVEHQGIMKCRKCRRAYLLETDKEEQKSSDLNFAKELGWE